MAKAVAKVKKSRPSPKKSVRQKADVKKAKAARIPVVRKFKCLYCGYIYSPKRGEPHNGIPQGTEFEDLPDTYVCPICGMEGKGKIGKWGFEEWRPTRFICSICGYIYDEARGEPHRGIKRGTKFEDLPDDYRCPICALDPGITKFYGKVLKQSFDPIDLP
jgi:rubredoxin